MKNEMQSKPFISIVTINYNQLNVTLEFLNSLKVSKYKNFEVIVVDNNSAFNPKETINKLYPEVKVLVNAINLGFAGGNNSGINIAKGDYILLINNDTEISDTLLELLLVPFYQDERVGVVSPKIVFYHSPDLIQYAGFNPLHPITGRTSAVGNMEKDLGQYNYLSETNGAHGCTMMVSRKVIDNVGLMPELYFLYYEEWDWSKQINKAGYKIMYQGNAIIYHKESISTGKNTPLKTYYHTRNRILFMRRHSSPKSLFLFYAFFYFITLPKNTLKCLFTGQLEHVKSLWKGVWWNLKNYKIINI
ncbi:glycosyltransferase family 2 protein [Chondrinema litorale]|uniref:glycosyltransferase family 2 protein n=1 Tax=Chondrinema litorale TaxID=2994555 RepID=UPI0025435F5C|nr:glycosyltransferase family 2 protein [Chondrinema litorale]UZS00109.1 glycosyltransferase family 2 protein [Chondrinema litorale]